MKPFQFNHWHAWTSFNGRNVMLSDESTKTLYQFPDVHACINWLFLGGYKDAARALNEHIKAK